MVMATMTGNVNEIFNTKIIRAGDTRHVDHCTGACCGTFAAGAAVTGALPCVEGAVAAAGLMTGTCDCCESTGFALRSVPGLLSTGFTPMGT